MARSFVESLPALPRPRPPVAGFARLGPKRATDAGLVFELASDQPQQIGQAIEIRNDRRLDGLAGLTKANDASLGAAAHCARHVEGGRHTQRPGTDQSDRMPSIASRR